MLPTIILRKIVSLHVRLNRRFPSQSFPMNYPARRVDVDIYEQVIRCGFTEKLSITAPGVPGKGAKR